MRAKKSLGQNFLNAPQVVKRMLEISDIHQGDIVLEIGPGKGVLTRALLEAGAKVHALELDERMVAYLNETLTPYVSSGQFIIHHTDVLKVNLEQLLPQPYKVVANIPYYITNRILRTFLSGSHQPTLMCLLVQKEVAERIAREPKESILSLSVKAYGTPRFIEKVPARYFSPQPKVDSAVLLIENITHSLFINLQHEERFFELVKQGFSQRRKQLLSNLVLSPEEKQKWKKLLEHKGYPSSVRAEDIAFTDWLYFSRGDR